MFRPRILALGLIVSMAATIAVGLASDSAIAAQSSQPPSAAPIKSSADTAQAPAPSASATASTGDDSADALNDPQRIAAGEVMWQKQCRHCHGRSAYPGKAPKLKPRKYKADFVYDRVTNGFRKMPPWNAVFSDDERWSIVAYVMSKKFSP